MEFTNDSDTAELEKNTKIDKTVDNPTRKNVIQIIQKCWDWFFKEGACRKKLGYEFGIDTGD